MLICVGRTAGSIWKLSGLSCFKCTFLLNQKQKALLSKTKQGFQELGLPYLFSNVKFNAIFTSSAILLFTTLGIAIL